MILYRLTRGIGGHFKRLANTNNIVVPMGWGDHEGDRQSFLEV
ncbi:hypothetical protein [Picosynechococcus sp. NKBG15041c]|nr:hypothetical protein [Picosynechococcus sp. NKBG15041c]